MLRLSVPVNSRVRVLVTERVRHAMRPVCGYAVVCVGVCACVCLCVCHLRVWLFFVALIIARKFFDCQQRIFSLYDWVCGHASPQNRTGTGQKIFRVRKSAL